MPSSIRALHVIPAVAPRYGGPSAAVVGMCAALRAIGVRTLTATTDADGPNRLPVHTDVESDFNGMPVVFFHRQASESFKWSTPLAKWLDDHVRDFDIVHIHAVFSHAAIAAAAACRRQSVPYLVRPLGSLDPWSLARHAWRKRLLLRLGVRSMLAGAEAIHYTSEEEGRLAQTALPWLPRSAVVPLGIDDEIFDAASSEREAQSPYVLALSRLDRKKGLEVLISAFHDAHSESLKSWSLVIAGNGDANYVKTLEELAAAGPASARIQFRGWVSGADRTRLLRGAGLFVSPSYQENFGISMVEAMAAGVPVMVSPGVNLGSEIESAGAGWVVVADRSVWARALSAVLQDESARDVHADRAREYSRRFRWPAVAESLRALYQQVASEASPQTAQQRTSAQLR